MNYLNVPDSKLKLTEGNVVMLQRFPGMKWVLHNGWYHYNGQQYMGWYFSSIPSQTILPVNNQDLRMITLISSKSNDAYPIEPGPPVPGCYPPPPHHGPHPHPPPFPTPDGPIFPPVPPEPEPMKPAFFSRALKEQLKEAFISVPTLKQRDALDTEHMPDGKIVRVNSVDGVTKYYVWSAFNDHWEDFNLVFDEGLQEELESYYQKTEIDSFVHDLTSRVDDADRAIQAVDDRVSELDESTTSQLNAIRGDITDIKADIVAITERLDGKDDTLDEDIAAAVARIEALEEAVFHIERLSSVTDDNSVLVVDQGTLKDSGFTIGDDRIDEPAAYSNGKALATEKAVSQKVEDAALKWGTF